MLASFDVEINDYISLHLVRHHQDMPVALEPRRGGVAGPWPGGSRDRASCSAARPPGHVSRTARDSPGLPSRITSLGGVPALRRALSTIALHDAVDSLAAISSVNEL